MKKESKQLYLQNKLKKCKNNIQNIWKTVNSIIGKFRVQNDSFPKSLNIVNEEITDKKSIAEKFNTGTNILRNLFKANHLAYIYIAPRSLRKKCPYSELFWSAFFPHFHSFRLNTER